MIKKLLFVIAFALPFAGLCQEQEFHLASNQFIHEKDKDAIATLDNAIQRYPSDKKLKALREQIKEEQKKKQEQEQKEQQEKKEQEQKEQEQKEQDEKEKKEKEEQEKQNKEKEDKEKKEDEKKKPQESDESKKEEQKEKQEPSLDKKKLEEMKISEEKARMILEAMKNQEKQYLQQNKRKATKSKDRTKPDW
jgi:outer membrane biosynthesis protein TonB